MPSLLSTLIQNSASFKSLCSSPTLLLMLISMTENVSSASAAAWLTDRQIHTLTRSAHAQRRVNKIQTVIHHGYRTPSMRVLQAMFQKRNRLWITRLDKKNEEESTGNKREHCKEAQNWRLEARIKLINYHNDYSASSLEGPHFQCLTRVTFLQHRWRSTAVMHVKLNVHVCLPFLNVYTSL